MNYTRKSILKKITRDFGSQIQNLPRKRKKSAKKLFSGGLSGVRPFQLALMFESLKKETTMVWPKGFGKGLVQFITENPADINDLLTPIK